VLLSDAELNIRIQCFTLPSGKIIPGGAQSNRHTLVKELAESGAGDEVI